MGYRAWVVGASVGALIGAISRVAVAAYHLTPATQDRGLVVLIAAVMGIITGALAGAVGKPVLGATVGAGLSVLAYLVNLPIVAFLHFLGALTTPTLLEVVAAGALAGGIGGAAAQMAARRQSGSGGRTSGQA